MREEIISHRVRQNTAHTISKDAKPASACTYFRKKYQPFHSRSSPYTAKRSLRKFLLCLGANGLLPKNWGKKSTVLKIDRPREENPQCKEGYLPRVRQLIKLSYLI
eukprot:UN24817